MKMDDFVERRNLAEEVMRAKRGAKPKRIPQRVAPTVGNDDLVQLNHKINSVASDLKGTEQALMDEINTVNADLNTLIKEVHNSPVREIRLRPNKGKIKTIKALAHKQFELLVKCAQVRNADETRKNILITGKMGGGKSTACRQLAELEGLEFDYIGQTNMPHIVVGSQHPLKDLYKHTPFTRIYRDGGVIVFEELDAWNPNASLVLNVPLANGYLTLEDGTKIKRHKDCIVIACANTWGTGATAEYVGRNKLDAAFLDRFAFKIEWLYDDALERLAAGNTTVVDAVQLARFNAERAGIKIAISPRASIDIAAAVDSGHFSLREAMDINFLAGLDYDARERILEDIVL